MVEHVRDTHPEHVPEFADLLRALVVDPYPGGSVAGVVPLALDAGMFAAPFDHAFLAYRVTVDIRQIRLIRVRWLDDGDDVDE